MVDAVRAAVNDEVEATEKAIRSLGYEVPLVERRRGPP
jgi:hypothetical protein